MLLTSDDVCITLKIAHKTIDFEYPYVRDLWNPQYEDSLVNWDIED